MADIDDYLLGYWDSKPFIDAANILVAADEPLKALGLLKNLPGFYRDHIPKQILKLRNEILSMLATPLFYAEENLRVLPIDQLMPQIEGLLRYREIKRDIQGLNAKGINPHLIDYGPGEYWLPRGLNYDQCKFKYVDAGLSTTTTLRDQIPEYKKDITEGDTVMLIACEIIEHLHHEEDIVTECLKLAVPDIVHLSTPKYTFDIRPERINWKSYGTLGHLRTYTPGEFVLTANRLFPGYSLTICDSKILHIRAQRGN